ncbi:collagen alpha-6(VI) chain-like [Tubulanus polymorphus]|uniref:collagen alpha-6(VI) chain-like n=1 Tax=Tubulanus polymorphus TaxID=672921 RepID=UPI003DA65851
MLCLNPMLRSRGSSSTVLMNMQVKWRRFAMLAVLTGLFLQNPVQSRAIFDGCKVDIVFLIDASGTWCQADFDDTRNYVKSFVNDVTVGPNDTRIGVVGFTGPTSTKTAVDFTDLEKDSIKQKLDYMEFKRCVTYTHHALNKAKQEIFSNKRENAKKVAVLITDGDKTIDTKFLEIAQEYKKANIMLVILHIGVDAVDDGLKKAAYKPDWVARLSGYNDLRNTLSTVHDVACPIRCRADVAFLVDGSTSLVETMFDQARRFVNAFADSVHVGDEAIRIGVVRFGSKSDLIVKFTDTDKESIKEKIDNMELQGGMTFTGKALQFTNENLFSESRPDARKLTVIVTDGMPSDPGSLLSWGTRYRADNNKLMFVVIGRPPSIDVSELSAAAYRPDWVIRLDSYAQLEEHINGVRDKVFCGCNERDMAVLLDSSISIPVELFEKTKDFIISYAKTLDIGQRATRFGLVRFSSTTATKTFVDFSDLEKDSILGKIKNLEKAGAMTQTGYAMEVAKKDLFDHARPKAEKIAIIITDGYPSSSSVLLEQGRLYKQDDIKVLFVLVGKSFASYFYDMYKEVAYKPDWVRRFDSYQDLAVSRDFYC